jgi:hypothetical protein
MSPASTMVCAMAIPALVPVDLIVGAIAGGPDGQGLHHHRRESSPLVNIDVSNSVAGLKMISWFRRVHSRDRKRTNSSGMERLDYGGQVLPFVAVLV